MTFNYRISDHQIITRRGALVGHMRVESYLIFGGNFWNKFEQASELKSEGDRSRVLLHAVWIGFRNRLAGGAPCLWVIFIRRSINACFFYNCGNTDFLRAPKCSVIISGTPEELKLWIVLNHAKVLLIISTVI